MADNIEELSEEELHARYVEAAKYFIQRAETARYAMPEYESKEFWLPHVIDAFAIINGSIDYIIEVENEQNRKMGCCAGCSTCCHQDVPVSPLEAIAVYFATHTYLQGETKEKVHKQLQAQNGDISKNHGQCPFLLDDKCSIYPLRPIACRSLLVFNEPCKARTYEEIEGTNLPLYITIMDNCRLPSPIATHLAYSHLSKICWELGMIEQGVLLNYDTSKSYFIDIRKTRWLDNTIPYARFLEK